jgi:hypothetical protein
MYIYVSFLVLFLFSFFCSFSVFVLSFGMGFRENLQYGKLICVDESL